MRSLILTSHSKYFQRARSNYREKINILVLISLIYSLIITLSYDKAVVCWDTPFLVWNDWSQYNASSQCVWFLTIRPLSLLELNKLSCSVVSAKPKHPVEVPNKSGKYLTLASTRLSSSNAAVYSKPCFRSPSFSVCKSRFQSWPLKSNPFSDLEEWRWRIWSGKLGFITANEKFCNISFSFEDEEKNALRNVLALTVTPIPNRTKTSQNRTRSI